MQISSNYAFGLQFPTKQIKQNPPNCDKFHSLEINSKPSCLPLSMLCSVSPLRGFRGLVSVFHLLLLGSVDPIICTKPLWLLAFSDWNSRKMVPISILSTFPVIFLLFFFYFFFRDWIGYSQKVSSLLSVCPSKAAHLLHWCDSSF